jgi:hypothetical protein
MSVYAEDLVADHGTRQSLFDLGRLAVAVGPQHIGPIAAKVVADLVDRVHRHLPASAFCSDCGAQLAVDTGKPVRCSTCRARHAARKAVW